MNIPHLIACDIDGTLLPAGQPQLRPETAELIARLRAAGIHFVPASGRQYPSLHRLFAPFASTMPFVAENGTIALMGEHAIYRATMDDALGDQIVHAVLERDTCEVMVSGARASYLQPKNGEFLKLLRDAIKYEVVVVDDVTKRDEPYSKISVYHPNAYDEEAYWRERFGAHCAVAVSGLTWVDLMPAGVSKASGLAAVCAELGVDPADCLAIGDADNDAEMFDFAGQAIAMETASVKAKAHADAITPNPDEVFARILAQIEPQTRAVSKNR